MIKHGRIISTLRRLWLFSEERHQCLRQTRIERGKYRCSRCQDIFKMKELQVNHKNPMGRWKSWDEYITKLFCEAIELEAVCVPCHKIITKEQKW